MITFFTAIGLYKITVDERGQNAPYIQSLGKLHAISIPEFIIWSNLLWEILTYDELKEKYISQLRKHNAPTPDFDELLNMLLARKLITRGDGYTGADALYQMLSDTFVLPHKSSVRRLLCNLTTRFSPKHTTIPDTEQRVLTLIGQTPLNVAEISRCFDLNLHDIKTPDKLIAGIYLTSDQKHISLEQQNSPNRNAVLQAVSNLYLHRKVFLELG